MLCDIYGLHDARVFMVYPEPPSEVRYRMGLHLRGRHSILTQPSRDHSESSAVCFDEAKGIQGPEVSQATKECAFEVVFLETEVYGLETKEKDLRKRCCSSVVNRNLN